MDIGIIGPGAMGTFLAGMLGEKNEVTLVGRRELDIEKVDIVGKTELTAEINFTTNLGKLSGSELVVICTKSYDTEEAVKGILDHLSPECRILSLQNGLENEEIISEHIGKERTIGGVTSHGVTYLDSGKVKHAGKGKTLIGSYPKGKRGEEELKRIVKLFNEGDISTTLSDNIIGHIWKKVIVNVGINPITALVGVKNGLLLKDEDLLELMKEAVQEASTVAEEYVDLPIDEPFKETKKVAKSTRDNKSSMLQDVEKKRRTEIDQINGAVVEKGEKSGIRVDVNRTLYRLVKGLQHTYSE